MNERRKFITHLSALLVSGPVAAFAEQAGAGKGPLVRVWKSPTCGCCSKWVDHMIAAGFEVEAENVSDVGVYKQRYGLPVKLASCHTAVVEGYVVEGHVPPADVIRLLKEKPPIGGIAVPGMPMGSPGMESPNPENYQTIAFDKDQRLSVFAEHGPDFD